MGTENIWNEADITDGKKPNTVSQLRVGIERVFGANTFLRNNLINSIGIKWIAVDGYENSIYRFYLEKCLITENFSLFNIDIER